MATTTNSNIMSWNPERTTLPATDVTPEALVLNPLVATIAATPQGDQTYVRIPFVAADPTADIVAEGAELPEGEATRAEIRVYTRKVGILQRVSREAYGQQLTADNGTANASDLFTTSLQRAVTAKLDGLFINSPSKADDVFAPGLAVDTTDAIIDGGNIVDNLDPLVDALATVADNGATPTCVLTSNSGWAKLQKLKYTDGRPVVNPDAQADTVPQLAGLPVVRNAAVPKDTLFVIDATNIVAALTDVTVDVDQSVFFTSDSIAVRVTARLGWGVVQRGRIARLKIGATTTDTTDTTTNGKTKLTVGA
ncbi:phage major capsid protein [Bifidobacterium callitrichos]|nr:phage major capsid protein [Bifidobacterium callitrichos]